MKQPPLSTPWTALVDTNNPLPEYPRPQMARSNWLNLNGLWQFQPGTASTDPVPTNQTLASNILVPFPMESALSGVMQYYAWSWYRRTFSVPSNWAGDRVFLHLDAATWQTTVYINGQNIGVHQGGYDPFSYDITPHLNGETNEIILQVYSPQDNGSQPRGKQTIYPGGIMYTSASGIWQPVWLEPVDPSGIANLVIVPDVDHSRLRLTVNTLASNGVTVCAAVLDNGLPTNGASGIPGSELDIPLANPKLWSPASPFLYGLQVSTIHNGVTNDFVSSYFGMRKIAISTSNGVPEVFLNNQFAFGLGTLDQGYWPDGIYTAPTDAALAYDLQEEKSLGFNSVRKHEKVERQRWYYWADTLGLMVWQDMPTCNSYTANPNPPAIDPAEFEIELSRLVTNHWNSPSIIMWDIFNEGQGEAGSSDGVGQASTASLVQLVQSLDPSRLVNQASGGAYFGVGSVFDNHNYPPPGDPQSAFQACIDGEFGAIGWLVQGHLWNPSLAYTGDIAATSTNDIITLYDSYLADLAEYKAGSGLSAGIYTQITDVENECDGFITYDRAVMKQNTNQLLAANQAVLAAPPFQIDQWRGGAADFDIPANWSSGTVPAAGTNVLNDSGSNNPVQINPGDPTWNINDLWAGDSSNASGTFVQGGSVVNAGLAGGTLELGINTGAIGSYTITGGTLNDSNSFLVGLNGEGVLNILGGTVNIGDSGTFELSDSASPGGAAVVNQTNGTLTCAAQLWLGQDQGSATWNLSGGVMNLNNWVAIGRAGGSGTFNMTGGVINKNATQNFLVGTSAGTGSGGTGVLNQSGGVINCAGQFLVPEEGSTSAGTYNMSGIAVLNVSNWLAIGRGSGTGIWNLGGGLAEKNDPGNDDHIDIGASGPGVLNQSGGLITNTISDFWLGESADGTWNLNGGRAMLGNVVMCVNGGIQSTLNLNGGVLTAGQITTGSPGRSSSVLNFNGGTLAASGNSSSFINNLAAINFLSGGATINSGAYDIAISQPLAGVGGLTKTGLGSLSLNGTNCYAGPTIVSAGTLSGTGTFSGPVTVAAGGTLSPGDPLGTLTVSNTLTLASGSVTVMAVTLSQGNSLVAGLSNVIYGGTLVLTNTGSASLLDGSIFQLFLSSTRGGGNFSQITVLPAGSGSATFDPATGRATFQSPPPALQASPASCDAFLISTSGGTEGAPYTILTSTNLAKPLSGWATNSSGQFGAGGLATNSVPLSSSNSSQFYRLRIP